MKTLLVSAVVPLVIFGYSLFFKWLDAKRRKRERRETDALKLSPSSRRATVKLPPKQGHLERVASLLDQRGARFMTREPEQWIAYLGEQGGDVQFRGIERHEASDMPLRISAYRTEGGVTIHIDEDFGWQLFMGPAKRRFEALYSQALAETEQLVRAE